jgi:hypothetical protein
MSAVIPWFNNFGDNEQPVPAAAFQHLLSHLSTVTSAGSIATSPSAGSLRERSRSQRSAAFSSGASVDADADDSLPPRRACRGRGRGRDGDGDGDRARAHARALNHARSPRRDGVGSRTLPAKLGMNSLHAVSTKTV